MHQECVAGLLRTGLASLFILVTPLLGLRLALRCRTLCAAFASTAPASFASKQCQSNIHNHSRVFHSPVRAQDSSNRSDKNHQPNVNMRIVGRATQEPKLRLSLETRVAEDVTVICCKGRIAYGAEAAALSGEFSELAPQTRRVVIDLSSVEMIDAAGLGALISVALTAQASQCSVTLAAPGNFIRQLLELTKLTSVFEVHPTLDAATVASRGQAAA